MMLYYSRGACSLAVRILIHELGLKAEYVGVDLKTKKTEKGHDFLKINPKGAVPVLILDNKEILTENAVIHQYLAEQNQGDQYLPMSNELAHYRVLEWLNFISTDIHKGFGPLFNSDVPAEVKEKIFIPILKKKLKIVEDHLKNKKYLLGDQFTLPDTYMFVMILWMPKFKFDMKEWPALDRYFTELKNREAFQKALKEEGIKR